MQPKFKSRPGAVFCAAFGAFVALLCLLPDAASAECGKRQLRDYDKQLSCSSLVEENLTADAYYMFRHPSLASVKVAIANGALHPVTDTEAYMLDVSFAEFDKPNQALYAHSRRQVVDFLTEVLGDAYALHKDVIKTKEGVQDRFRIASLTRPEEYQKLVKRWHKRYAAKGDSPHKRSTHMTGSTVDIGTSNLPIPVRHWLRQRLADLEKQGLILARREGQGCLHVFVLPTFTPERYRQALVSMANIERSLAKRDAVAGEKVAETGGKRQESGLPD